MYPTITTTLFRVPQCQYFGDSAFHEDDYTIDCGTTKFQATVAFALFVIILIPIGVPVAFLFLMLRAKRSIGGVVNTTAEGGAKLVPADDDDESDAYGFLIKDYRPECWYHEIVTYSRKLTLTGVSVVMGRGSMAQTYFVITTEAFFQIHHVRTYPFVNYKHNVIEALGHCALMLLYAVSLILRNESEDDWSDEWFPKEGYGWFLVLIFAIVLPSPIVFFFVKDKDSALYDDSTSVSESDNPLAVGSKSTKELAQTSGSKPPPGLCMKFCCPCLAVVAHEGCTKSLCGALCCGPLFTLFCWNPKAADAMGVITPAAPGDAAEPEKFFSEEFQDNPLTKVAANPEGDSDAAVAVDEAKVMAHWPDIRDHPQPVSLFVFTGG